MFLDSAGSKVLGLCHYNHGSSLLSAIIGWVKRVRGIFVYSVPALQRHNNEHSKQIFLQKELRDLSPNFHIHVFVSNFYIPVIDLSILLQENMWTDPGNT